MKRLSACIILVIFVLISTGCSGQKSTSEGPWEGQNLKRTTLTFYFPYGESSEMPAVLKELEKKASSALNVSLDFKYIPGTMGPKLRDVIEAGQPCDVYLTDNSSYKLYYELGLMKDIKNLFPRYAPEYYKSFEKAQTSSLFQNGKMIGIPSNLQPYYIKPGVFIRDDILAKYGREIKSIADYGAFLAWVKSNYMSTTPVYFSYFNTLSLANAAGYSVVADAYNIVYRQNDKAMKLVSWEQTPEYKKLLETYLGWYKNGYIAYNAGNQGNAADPAITSGKYASIMANSSFGVLENYNSQVAAKGLSWRYRLVDIYPGAVYDRKYNTSQFLAFSSKSKNVERALMFIEWLHQDIENYKLLTIGIQGKDYIWDDKKGVTFSEEMDPELSYLSWAGLQVFRSYKLDVLLIKTQADLLKAYMKDVEKSSANPFCSGFTYDQTEINDYVSSLNLRTRNRGGIEFQIAHGNIDNIDIQNYIDEQKPTSDKLVEKFQSLLDEWKSEQK